MAKLIVELDLAHECFADRDGFISRRFKAAARRLREVADRLDSDSYETIHDGVVRADAFVPSECGTIRIHS